MLLVPKINFEKQDWNSGDRTSNEFARPKINKNKTRTQKCYSSQRSTSRNKIEILKIERAINLISRRLTKTKFQPQTIIRTKNQLWETLRKDWNFEDRTSNLFSRPKINKIRKKFGKFEPKINFEKRDSEDRTNN